MTRKEVEARMKALVEELGLEMQPESMTKGDGTEVGVGFNLDRRAVEALPVDQQARLEDLRYELAAEMNGTQITFTTRHIEPGHVRLQDEKLLDGDDELVVNVTCPAADFSHILRLASVGMALVPPLLSGNATDQEASDLAEWITNCFQSPTEFQIASYKADEIGNLTNRAYLKHQTESDAAALDGIVNVEQMFGGC